MIDYKKHEIKDMNPVYNNFINKAKQQLESTKKDPVKILSLMLKKQDELIDIYFKRVGENLNNFNDRERTYWFVQMTLAILDEINETIEISRLTSTDERDENDLLNIKFEIIDTIHFVMEIILLTKYFKSELYNYDDIAEKIINTIPKYNYNVLINIDSFFEYLYKMMKIIHWKHWKTYKSYTKEDLDKIEQIAILFFSHIFDFFRVTFKSDIEEFALLYLTKRLENEDRQKRGY